MEQHNVSAGNTQTTQHGNGAALFPHTPPVAYPYALIISGPDNAANLRTLARLGQFARGDLQHTVLAPLQMHNPDMVPPPPPGWEATDPADAFPNAVIITADAPLESLHARVTEAIAQRKDIVWIGHGLPGTPEEADRAQAMQAMHALLDRLEHANYLTKVMRVRPGMDESPLPAGYDAAHAALLEVLGMPPTPISTPTPSSSPQPSATADDRLSTALADALKSRKQVFYQTVDG